MKTEVNMESLEGMSFAEYKKALKKDKKYLKKAKGIMFVNDHKFKDKKGLAVMLFRKPKEVKECFKDLKKKGHPSPKMAGGSCEMVDGDNGPELKVDLKLGGLTKEKIEAKGKSYLKSALGLMPTISAGDPKDSDGQVDAQEQAEINDLQAEFNELKNQLPGVKKAIDNFKAGKAKQEDAVAVEEFVAEAKEWLIKFKNEADDVKKQLKEQALKLKEQYTKLAPALAKIQEQADKNDPQNFLEKMADKAGDFLGKVKDKVEDLFDGDEDAWEDDDISDIGQEDVEDPAEEDPEDSVVEDVEETEDPTEDDLEEEAPSDGAQEEVSQPTVDIPSDLGASVGKGGKNNQEDVKVVQELLNQHGASLTVDGLIGPSTIAAIKAFQQAELGFADGRVDPGGKTWSALIDVDLPQDDVQSDEDDIAVDDVQEEEDEPTQEVLVTPNANLTAPVGQGKANVAEDVAAVQFLLNKEEGTSFVVDGVFTAELGDAITTFQKEVMKFSRPDGVVDPGGKTWKGLNGQRPGAPPPGPVNKPNWIKIAEREVGVKENTSKTEHNPRVIEYHATTGGFKDDETPWCSSFVNWVMKKAGHGGTNSAAAVSWRNWGQKVDEPAYGAIAVIDWDGPGPGWKGHVGFVVGKQGSSILLLGGNQANAVNVKTFGTSKVVAYVYPSGFDIPANFFTFGEAEGDFGDEVGFDGSR